MTSRRQLYAAELPLGDSLTRSEAGRVIYGGGGGSDSTASTARTIPDELKPLAQRYADVAINYSNKPFQSYTGQRYADLNNTQNQAIQMIQNRATNGSPVMDQANSTLTSALNGGNTNPYLDQLVNKANQSVISNYNMLTKPQLESSMVNSGSFGNSGLQQMQQIQQKAAAQQMSDNAAQMYGNAYNTDRANQIQALQIAPTYGNQAYSDANQLLQAGNTQQNQAQNNLDFGYQQWNNQQNYPLKQMQAMSGVLGQSMGTATAQSGGGK